MTEGVVGSGKSPLHNSLSWGERALRGRSLLPRVGHRHLQLMLLCTALGSLLGMAGQTPTSHPVTRGLSQSQGQQPLSVYCHMSAVHLWDPFLPEGHRVWQDSLWEQRQEEEGRMKNATVPPAPGSLLPQTQLSVPRDSSGDCSP